MRKLTPIALFASLGALSFAIAGISGPAMAASTGKVAARGDHGHKATRASAKLPGKSARADLIRTPASTATGKTATGASGSAALAPRTDPLGKGTKGKPAKIAANANQAALSLKAAEADPSPAMLMAQADPTTDPLPAATRRTSGSTAQSSAQATEAKRTAKSGTGDKAR